ncbi:MAG: hypothetical protein KGJ06_06035 [Pseudomonadota bacterium]|nr:hypothetical protein [Pseudomonadota bacterium]
MSLKISAKSDNFEARVEFDGKPIYTSKGSMDETLDLSPVLPLLIYGKGVWDQLKTLFPIGGKFGDVWASHKTTDLDEARKKVAVLADDLGKAKADLEKLESLKKPTT